MDERQEVFMNRRRHLREEIRAIFADAAHWNRIHPDEEPIDPDPDDTLQRLAEECDAYLEGSET